MRRSGLNAVAVPLACLLTAQILVGCAATPSRRPLKTTPVTSGEGTTEAIRKQLEGTWSLTSFSVFDAAGKPTAVEASGRLAYDAYGNLDLSGKINDPAAAGGSAAALNFKGRAVVDVGGSRIVLADVSGNVDPSALPTNMGIDKVRYYSFEGDTLSLETRDGTRVLARTVWKRVR
ncbi:hypothetical protein LuPra_05403 [Luteitalea pratensis]|uniref:Lipocalin-like domain-containing protein n=1 Tax=Luteitalea pratensis TaxID=1855912 RepID=A0A143PUS5_LUTPR|nr:hypothetical protein [Luteitalea pratensis]AMY12131.1 hypothetical protein LuPra_05403 [Luteitalea pratensis]